jgi:hypothetical protein
MCPFGAISPDLNINYTVHFMHINNFPWAWQDRNNIYVPSAGLPPPPPGVAPPPMSFLSQYANVFGNFLVPPPPPPPPAANTPANSVAQLSQKLAHVHLSIRNEFAEYHKKYSGRVLLSRLLQLGNIELNKLPTLPEMIDKNTGKNNLCYNYCLGVCPHGNNCAYKRVGGHVSGAKLSDQFVANLCQVIKPGVAAAMYLSPGRPAPGGSNPDTKKPRS